MKDKRKIEAVDLFCGIGGLTKGLQLAGIKVVAGIDNDEKCKYGYETSTGATFIGKSIENISAKDIEKLYSKGAIRVLAGCAPCQSYSGLNRGGRTEDDNVPIKRFAYLIRTIKPEIVTMENVRGLRDTKHYPVFDYFLGVLKRNGYDFTYDVVNAADYGVPQERKRLVLVASRIGKGIKLIDTTHKGKHVTVRDVIGRLRPIKDGEIALNDPLHHARKLSDINKKRIKATPKNGGNARSWNEELILDCYKKDSGQTYMGSVYGRMRWDKPAPTMTTQCTGLGNGRFGHPEQHRAISLREAAKFQTFPRDYVFFNPKEDMIAGDVARFIGNAVPVRLGEVIGKSILEHINAD
jgi:DNA (cytosine-5)-methyltransferase 1